MKVAVIGASGYVGAELVGLLLQHDKVSISHLVVSENSTSNGSLFSELHARWLGICDVPLQAFSEQWFNTAVDELDAVFFATPHEFSADWAQAFIDKGVQVFDLSGGFRLKAPEDYPTYYGFSHANTDALAQAQYGLAEWLPSDFADAALVAVPGCYPTASLLSLKPVVSQNLHLENSLIVVNGISGVSGAGRNGSLATSFNEVSLRPYNILKHRHQPEISQEAGAQVIFNPHLAPFKRGLLATVTLSLKADVTSNMVDQAFTCAYQDQPLVRIKPQCPQIDDVAHTPFADIYWQYDESKQVLVVTTAIDNLLKGAASQAVQCLNAKLNLPLAYSLIAQQSSAARS
ncbi:N-acetyl-gamma-glutamyl-phosphate reductase [Thalassotalea euphylliae]|uniref:N-acetyl-gamma-glutamyl-phosphate reductase n=1 Tax=Thalassotalea euphylliae TaxID=1655234 RepID=A0A3E0TV99_9GAMM|nr:N-acetyl-gamma-glutamyl-phosphate reductase [Thalassotalea euphylliae]REL28518.1 N-acetyl-gamma-glutamyl-phosphate reductase [Thalassotalea euphylliae]